MELKKSAARIKSREFRRDVLGWSPMLPRLSGAWIIGNISSMRDVYLRAFKHEPVRSRADTTARGTRTWQQHPLFALHKGWNNVLLDGSIAVRERDIVKLGVHAHVAPIDQF